MRRLLVSLAISLTSSGCSGPDADLPPEYRRMEVPVERLRTSEAVARGEELYEANCILCHGEGGNGRGRRSAAFATKPTRFADPAWRRQITPRRVFFVVREGLQGTPMPSWSWLSGEETWDVVAYVLTLAGDAAPEKRPSP